jgi:endonuclease-3
MPEDISAILKKMRKAVDRPAVVSHTNPFKVLIATVLSQRTKDQNTARATARLFEKYKSAEELASAPLPSIQRLVKPSGFYKVKARRIKGIAKQLVESFEGKVPSKLEQLLSLPGVGRKTANCVLVYGFGKPAMPVDVHVNRISNRIGLVKTKNPEQTELALMKIVPKKHWLELNHLMVRYGQSVCLPTNPKCSQCEIRPVCSHFLNLENKKQV